MNTTIQRKTTTLPLLIAIALLFVRCPAFAAPNNNTNLGFGSLPSNTDGEFNTGIGFKALNMNLDGNNNTAIGARALAGFNTGGGGNAALGVEALVRLTRGIDNTAIGNAALWNLTDGNFNIALGFFAGQLLTTGDQNIDIGNQGVNGDSATIRIGEHHGRTFIAGISGTAVTGPGVVVDASGQLGVLPSSARFKNDIKPMDKASEAILALKPVTFRYKKEIDSKGIPQFGLVAEEVEKINPDLIARDADGKPYTVRYDAVNAMLLNEFLKEHRKVEEQSGKLQNQARKIQEQEATITQLKKDFGATSAQLTARLDEQASQIQKVSAQIEASKPAPQTVLNNQ